MLVSSSFSGSPRGGWIALSLRAMAEHMQATPLQMTMDAGDAAAETIDASDAAALSRCAAAPIDAR